MRHLMAMAVCAVCAGCSASDRNLPPVTLIGERAGVLVWRPIEGATVYQVQVVDSAGTVVMGLQATDTVSPLPPLFEPPPGARWWVRAFSGERAVAASRSERLY